MNCAKEGGEVPPNLGLEAAAALQAFKLKGIPTAPNSGPATPRTGPTDPNNL